jgi:hypothetical protein
MTLALWKHPPDYGGFSPDGDFILLERTRDSDCLENSNYETALERLKEVAAQFPPPPDQDEGRFGWVYDFRARHWACGWVETLLIRRDAPAEVIARAEEIDSALADYPVLDEEDVALRKIEAAQHFWESLPLRWKIEECCERGLSMFAARSESPPYEMEDEF